MPPKSFIASLVPLAQCAPAFYCAGTIDLYNTVLYSSTLYYGIIYNRFMAGTHWMEGKTN